MLAEVSVDLDPVLGWLTAESGLLVEGPAEVSFNAAAWRRSELPVELEGVGRLLGWVLGPP